MATWLTPWFAVLAGTLFVFFALALFILILAVALQNENTTGLVMGVPRNFAWVFGVPLLFAVASILVVAGTVSGWVRGNWGMGRRIYYGVVAASALGLTVWLAVNGVLTIFFA